MSQIMTDTNKI